MAPGMPGGPFKGGATEGGKKALRPPDGVGGDHPDAAAPPSPPEGAALFLRALAEAVVDEVVRLRNGRGLTGRQIAEHFCGGDEETKEQLH